MNKYFILLFIFFSASKLVQAQDSDSLSYLNTISGKIVSDKDVKLSNITIRIYNEINSYKVMSDADGFYNQNVQPGTYIHYVNFPGFNT